MGILTLHMLKLRFINRERTEDCSPLMVSGQVSDASLTFLGVYVSQQTVFVRFGSNFDDLNLEYKKCWFLLGIILKLERYFLYFTTYIRSCFLLMVIQCLIVFCPVFFIVLRK